MRLRQVALVARDLEAVVDALCDVLGLQVAFCDPAVGAFGLRNAVLPVGDTFLEVVSPVQPGTTAERFLERRGGDGGYMVILQSADLDRDRARVAALGVRVVWSIDLPDIRGTHLHPRDVGAAILSLDAATPPASWRWAGPEWQQAVRTHCVRTIAAVEIQGDDPGALARRWSDILDLPACRDDDGMKITLEQGMIRFVSPRDGRGDGVSGIDLEVVDRSQVVARAAARGLTASTGGVIIGGTRIRLV